MFRMNEPQLNYVPVLSDACCTEEIRSDVTYHTGSVCNMDIIFVIESR